VVDINSRTPEAYKHWSNGDTIAVGSSVKNSSDVKAVHRIRLMGQELIVYQEVSSTNTIAANLATTGVPEGTIVLSQSQSAGRGRLNRRWICPPHQGILMSLILRPQIKIQYIPQLTLLGGVVVAEAIREVTGLKAGIKWPNDIMINDKKVCGILAESSLGSSVPLYVIIGFGINVNLNPDDLPLDCRATSTSLKAETGHNLSRLLLIKRFVSIWNKHYQYFLANGPDKIREKWINNNVTLGREVLISRGEEIVSGVATDISENGALIVKTSDGSICEYMAGDVTLVKKQMG
jgi:BirA family biotin operon repressor/biotin-[acetyl-CoA-carboxylase] ligase